MLPSVMTAALALLVCLPVKAQVQHGKATFYAKKFLGNRTASGERLHADSLTCAHRTLPFGTMVRVTNPANGKSVVVRVTDRGPFVKGRIVDLSPRAARELGIIAQGVAMVKLEVVNRRGVPYKDEAEEELPQVDFEMADVSYSFIDNWRDEALRNHPAASTQVAKPEEDQALTVPSTEKSVPGKNPAKVSLPTDKEKKKTVTTKKKKVVKRKVAVAPAEQEQAAPKKESNAFSDIFDRIKHWKD